MPQQQQPKPLLPFTSKFSQDQLNQLKDLLTESGVIQQPETQQAKKALPNWLKPRLVKQQQQNQPEDVYEQYLMLLEHEQIVDRQNGEMEELIMQFAQIEEGALEITAIQVSYQSFNKQVNKILDNLLKGW